MACSDSGPVPNRPPERVDVPSGRQVVRGTRFDGARLPLQRSVIFVGASMFCALASLLLNAGLSVTSILPGKWIGRQYCRAMAVHCLRFCLRLSAA